MGNTLLNNAISKFNLFEFLDENNIDYAMEGKNIGVGFIGIYECPNCFTKDTLILTKEGLKPIIDININDSVLTEDGKFNRVIQCHKHKLDTEDLIEYFCYGMVKSAKVTCNHNIFCAEVIKGKHIGGTIEKTSDCKNTRSYQSWYTGKIEAKDLISNSFKNSNIWIELPNIEPLFNEYIDYAYFLGLYCAEGCIVGNPERSIVFCLNNTTKLDRVNYLIKEYPNAKIFEKGKNVRVYIHSVDLIPLFKKCGQLSHNKVIPHEILFNSNKKTILEFINGIESDAAIVDNMVYFTTTSLHLNLQLSILLRRLGIPASINGYKKENTDISGIHRKEVCSVIYNKNRNKRHCNIKYINGKWYGKLKIAKRSRKLKCYVYNLTVENNHSYCANGSIVKNCGIGNYHYGINIEKKYGTCWQCNKTDNLIGIIKNVLQIRYKEAKEYLISSTYSEEDIELQIDQIFNPQLENKKRVNNKKIVYPKTVPLYKYIGTNKIITQFCKDKKITQSIAKDLDLQIGTNSKCKNKLIIPIYYGKELVAYQARSFINRYFYNEGEIKHYLYQYERIKKGGTIIIVEGVTDWISTNNFIQIFRSKKNYYVTTPFSKIITQEQLELLEAKDPTMVVFMLDRDAWYQYYQPSYKLFCDTNFIILPPNKDPGEMTNFMFMKTFLEHKL